MMMTTDPKTPAQTNLIGATLDQLKGRLLDLSKRNRLINFRSKRSANIGIVDELPAEVYRILAINRKAMRFKAALTPEVVEDETGDAPGTLALPVDLPPVSESGPSEAHVDLWLQTRLKAETLDSKLRRLADQARSVIEEQGVNALFLALAMLTYYESDTSDVPLKAPLLLLPVALERRAAGQPYAVQATDDDPILNPALGEMLLKQFGLKLPEPPDTWDSLDPVAFMNDLRAAVVSRPRWAVTDEISLGLFSFHKFVMYKDLERNRELFEKHPLVGMLATRTGQGGLGLPSDVAGLSLDTDFRPEETFQVVDADSSQQRAIAAVERGHSLVLQGPPGTGKSQTITNLVANALANGKTVLFVSEKMAALQVVYSRLASVGLADFCLELHSNHSNKKAFLRETERALNATLSLPVEPASIAARLQHIRGSLTEYVKAIHTRVAPLNWTPYRAYGELAALAAAPVVPLGTGVATQTDESFRETVQLVSDLATVVARLGKPAEHPWRDVGRIFFDGESRRTLNQALSRALDVCRSFVEAARVAVVDYGLKQPTHVADRRRVLDVAAVLERSPGVALVVLTGAEWNDPPELALKLIETGLRYTQGRMEALKRFRPEELERDHSREATLIARYGSQLLRMLNADYRRARSEWLAMRLPGYAVSLQQQWSDLKELDATQKHRAFIEEHRADGERLFGTHWRGIDSDWDALRAYIDWIVEFRALCVEHGLDRRVADRVVQPRPDVGPLRRLAALSEQVEAERLNLIALLEWPRDYLAQASVLDFARRVKDLQIAEGGFSDWRAFTAAREKVALTLAAPIGEQLASGTLAPGDAAAAFRRAFVEKWLDGLVESRPLLRDFSSITHEARLAEFRQLDKRVLDDNRSRIQRLVRDRVQQQLRSLNGTPAMRHLQTQMAKNRGHAPLRQTLRTSYTALQAIKPCFMMSPMTVAQFLDPQLHHFDLVVFDEASQLTAEDAMGAVMRGDQLIVVGDPKQLPPTNFFAVQSGQVEPVSVGDDEVQVEDFESILEQFQAAGASTARLRWHYRSRHESLIAFSNATYYDRDLLTFPSADVDRSVRGLQFEYVEDGIYEGAGLNRVEARRVAEAVIEHARKHPDLTLGVGTFNMRQQLAVQDELERLRRENPDVEPFFAPRVEGGFFVKNLENIQGDDRHVIFLSVTYARGPEGKLRHNFGPINGPNGWRRLNVLITRAQLTLRVFASMRGEEIDLTKTTSQGAHDLREFLIFAERGELVALNVDANAETESAFEDDVRRALGDRGHRLVPQVGVAGYRIDFGVLDDQVQGRFVCGVECDGAAYHSAETARDRDRLRQEILEGLGWQIVRVWSTDWFKDRAGALRRLLAEIEACRQRARQVKRDADRIEAPASPKAPDPTPPAGSGAQPVGFERAVNGDAPRLVPAESRIVRSVREYRRAQLAVLQPVGVLATRVDQLERLIGEVVAVEAPVHADDLYSRVAQAVGDRKAGSRIVARLDEVSRAGHRNGRWVYRNQYFYRRDGKVDVRSRAATGIPGERVAPEEYQAAVREVLAEIGPCSEDELVVGVRTLLGFNRTGVKLQTRIDEAIRLLIDDGVVGHAANGLGLRDER